MYIEDTKPKCRHICVVRVVTAAPPLFFDTGEFRHFVVFSVVADTGFYTTQTQCLLLCLASILATHG